MKKKRRYLRWVATIIGGLGMLYFASALIMISLPMPVVPPADVISKEEAMASGMTVEQFFESEPSSFTMRDGAVLHGVRYPSSSPHAIVFLHGASGHSSQLNKSIGAIREASGVEVFTYDHRGHGSSPGKRGDLDYIDQYVTDASDVLKAVNKLKPDGKIILAGHSMGGGIIQRYAMSAEPGLADAYLLFAPALGQGVPGEVIPRFAKPHIPRFLGILMLNAVGIERFNHMPVVNTGFPEFDGHINQYSFNSALSMRPDDFQSGMAALQKPTIVILGERDTATGVTAESAAQLFKTHSDAEVMIVPNERHHVQNSPRSITTVADWLQTILN